MRRSKIWDRLVQRAVSSCKFASCQGGGAKKYDRRRLFFEPLEGRQLLAADLASAWQNEFRPLDTNQDDAISEVDLLVIHNAVNANSDGAEGEDSVATGFYPDVNGDAVVNAVDSALVESYLTATSAPPTSPSTPPPTTPPPPAGECSLVPSVTIDALPLPIYEMEIFTISGTQPNAYGAAIDMGDDWVTLEYQPEGPDFTWWMEGFYLDDGARQANVVVHNNCFTAATSVSFTVETVDPRISATGEVQRTDISVVHSGADHSAKGRQRKYVRDLKILGRELERRPEYPFVLFNLGMTHADMDDHDTAVDYLRRCVAVSALDESHLRKAYALLVSSLEHCGRTDEACDSCDSGLGLFPDDPELRFRCGMLAHSIGDLQGAEAAYLKVIHTRNSDQFSSVDPGIMSYKARHNLGLVTKLWSDLTWLKSNGEIQISIIRHTRRVAGHL